MSGRLAELTARRMAIQARCAEQRATMATVHGGIQRDLATVDHAAAVAHSLLPLLAVAGVAGLIVIGPTRTLTLLRRGLSIALFATQALAFIRASRG